VSRGALRQSIIVPFLPESPIMAERSTITPAESEELRGLWREYHRATTRVLEIMHRDGSDGPAGHRIIEEDANAAKAIKRIRQILGVTEPLP
jgi:type IV pilus biogenesis protein CpaD/CtpE